MMRKRLSVALVVGLAVAVSVLSFADSRGKLELKAGDEFFVCNCGEGCPCQTISRNPGTCTCGKDLVKANVTKAEASKANFKAASWEKERSFNTIGKYACDCPPACKCDTISQNPGNCTCGKPLKEVKM